jgi:hypothetical protein
MAEKRFNDRIIDEGFPRYWYVQDRLDEGTALLCRSADFTGSRCVCVRPRALSTDEWLATARKLAHGFERMLDQEYRDNIARAAIADAGGNHG